MEFKGENFSVTYDKESQTVACEGSLRLYGKDGYEQIAAIFEEAAATQPDTITLDLQKLQFLNSAGINTISKFVIKVRNLKTTTILVKGSKEFPWQNKSLKNLQRLMPTLTLEII